MTARRVRRAIVGLAVICVAYPAPGAVGSGLAAGPGDGASRFERTILSLAGSSEELRAAFAEVALTELASIYLAEADLARSQAAGADRPGKLLRWSLAVDRYADDLLLVLEDVRQGFPVAVLSGSGEGAILVVAERRVVLSHPRLNQQGVFQQQILADFCAREDCEPLTAGDEEAEAIPVSPSVVNPLWAFTEQGPVCSHRGLSVRFSSGGNLGRQRGVCHQLFQELAVLATEFAWQRRHGAEVDWPRLAIQSTPHQPEHIVMLNRSGDSILVSVPLLYSAPGLLADVVPWLQAVYGGRAPEPRELRAENYAELSGL